MPDRHRQGGARLYVRCRRRSNNLCDPTEQLPLIQAFSSSSGDGADKRTRAWQVLEELPKDFLLTGGVHFKVVSWNNPGRRFLAVIGASRIGKSPLGNAGSDDAPGGAEQIR